jgi:hypothetical protein
MNKILYRDMNISYDLSNKIKKYITLIEPVDSAGNYRKNTNVYNHVYTEVQEKINIETTYQGENIAVIETSKSPLVSINKVGYNLNFVPYKNFNSDFERFNNISISKSSSKDIDGKYIIASIYMGSLYYSENFGLSWIKI